jgi:SSS family transporter
MTWLPDHIPHVVLVVLYLSVLAYHALLGRRHAKTLDGYLVANRGMGGLVIALSFYATFMSTNTFIGAAGQSWEHGLTWCLGGVLLTALACISWLVVAPRFVPLTREYDSLTLADFLGTHYRSQAVRRIAGVLVAFASVCYLVAIYRGASLALAAFLDLPYLGCLAAVFAVVTLYTLTGGFESVVLTDTFQGLIMVLGAVALFVSLLIAGGGPVHIIDRLGEIDPALASLTAGPALSATLAYSLAVGVKYLVEPRQLSRFYGLKDDRALRLGRWVSPAAILLSYLCLLPLGAMARTVLAPGAVKDLDQVVPYLLGTGDLIGPVVGSLFLLVLISAAMSSIDSVLLVAGSTIDRDLLRLAGPEDQADPRLAVRRIRLWVVVVSLAAAASGLPRFTQDIVRMTKFSGSLYGACFLPVLVVGLFMRKRSARVAILTMLAGSACVIAVFALRTLKLTTLQEVYPGIAVGLLVFLVLTPWSRRILDDAAGK